MTPVSCYVLTLNSERRLRPVLAAVRDVVDEIVIVDSGSTDRTLAIAASFDCRIVTRQFDNFRNQRVFGKESCRHNWILELDSDEIVTPELAGEIAALKSADFHATRPDAPDGYTIPREWFMLGRKTHVFYPVSTPDRVLRLFRGDTYTHKHSPPIHERVSGSKTSVADLDGLILHYTCDSVDQLYSKINLYTRLSAEEMHAKGIRASFLRVHLFPYLLSAQYFFLLGGWKDGAIGRLHARYVRDIVYLKYAKLRHDFPTTRES
jgi:glycosyltransferase involved in cell wall biosynthesis